MRYCQDTDSTEINCETELNHKRHGEILQNLVVQKEQFKSVVIETTLNKLCSSIQLNEKKSHCGEQNLKQLGIVGTSLKGTQKPAGKMKFTIILIGVMLLRGIELHRHMNWHGHKEHRTDPQTEIKYETYLRASNALNGRDELTSVGKAVERQQSVDATQTQKDVRSHPGNEIENVFKIDGTKMAQDKPRDGNIMPKPGLRKNKLVAKYGTNFRYLGIVKNGIDRVTVVTSIPIPRYENVKIRPINFAKCAQGLDDEKGHSKMADTQASKVAKEWCAQAIPCIWSI